MAEFDFPGWTDGVNNVEREDRVPPAALRSAVNVDIDRTGGLRRRRGYTRRVSLSDARSGVSHLGFLYLADQADFLRVDPSDFSTEIVAELPPQATPRYAPLNENLYVTFEGGEPFRITPSGDAEPWAPEHPWGQPALQAASMGSLPPGEYQVAVTFLRGREESGTGKAATVTLTAEGSIVLTDIPVSARQDTTGVRVYVTTPSGTVLYFYGDYPVGTSTIYLTRLPEGKQLETQFMEPLPAGHIVTAYRGRLYSAVGNRVYYSRALRYGLCNPAQDFFDFSERVDMVRPVENGVFVGAGKRVVFLAGTNPDDMQQTIAHHSGAVEGTDTEVPAGMFSFENLSTGFIAAWWSKVGVMVLGFPNGQVQPVRQGELALPEFARGATMLREEDGVQQLVSVLSQPKTPQSALAARDEAVVTVHRRGIEI